MMQDPANDLKPFVKRVESILKYVAPDGRRFASFS